MKWTSPHISFGFVLVSLFLVKETSANKFRVLVAFTSQAETQGFSPYDAASAINGVTRDVYENSSPNYTAYQMPEVELAGTVKVAYTGTSMGAAVDALKSKTDNKMDEIHALRDSYKADIVILVHPFSPGGGRAYMVDASNESKAFAVVSTESFWSWLSAHEIGHLVGCIHNDQDPFYVYPAIEYAYGYIGPANAWGDVMTYHTNIKRWFSNPYETFNSAPRGIADSADCTRKHHERKATIAGYRTAASNSAGFVNHDLKTNESIFWDVPDLIVGLGLSYFRSGSLVSLKSSQGVLLSSIPQAPITSEAGAIFLKSSQNVQFSGILTASAYAHVVADSLLFKQPTETAFRGAIANLYANVIRQRSGAIVTIEPDSSNSWGSYIMMYARRQIRLTTGFGIKSKNVFMRVSDSYDPFDPANGWENVLEKPGVSPDQSSALVSGSFQSRVVQERSGLSLEYKISEHGPLSVRVLDLKGQLAGSVDIRHPKAGVHTVAIPGRFRSGTVYFVRVTANGKVQTHRFVKGF